MRDPGECNFGRRLAGLLTGASVQEAKRSRTRSLNYMKKPPGSLRSTGRLMRP